MAVGLDSAHSIWHGMGNRFTDTPTPPTCAICAKEYNGEAPWIPPPSTHRPTPTRHDGICVQGEPITFFTVADAHRRLRFQFVPRPEALRDLPFRSMPLTSELETEALEICQHWPGPICPTCWASSCDNCGYTFESWNDACAVGNGGRFLCYGCTPPELRPGPQDDAPIHSPRPSPFDSACASDVALLGMDLGDEPVFHVGDWVEVMRMDGNDVRYGEIVACWAQLSPAESCGFETWYRVNFGSDSVRCEMDVPDTEIIDALPQ